MDRKGGLIIIVMMIMINDGTVEIVNNKKKIAHDEIWKYH